MLFPSVVGDCSEVFRVLVHAENGRAFGVILVGKSGWKVHGTRLSCGSNGIPQKVILFFSGRNVPNDSVFRFSRPFFP